MQNPKDQIRFILCGTQFASNLGRAARVMKNMGFERLILVQPECEVGVEARTGAMRGDGILDRADFAATLEDASRQVDLLVGTTARLAGANPRRAALRTFAEEIVPAYLPNRIGIAFGAEGNGLTRQEIDCCQWLVEIPTSPEYPSLNLSQAVAVAAYELHVALSGLQRGDFLNAAPPELVRGLLERAEETLRRLHPPDSLDLEEAMRRIARVAGRARLEREDVNLIRGLLKLGDETPASGGD